MASTRQTFRSLELGARCVALLPIAEDCVLSVEMSAGCEQFVGRYARLAAFRHGQGIIRFRTCSA